MRKNIWTTLAIFLAILSFGSGLNLLLTAPEQGAGNILAGEVMLLGALACRSANRRRFKQVESTTKRIAMEFGFIVIMILVVVLRNNLKVHIASDPVPNLLLPLISFIFYSLAYIKAKKAFSEISV